MFFAVASGANWCVESVVQPTHPIAVPGIYVRTELRKS